MTDSVKHCDDPDCQAHGELVRLRRDREQARSEAPVEQTPEPTVEQIIRNVLLFKSQLTPAEIGEVVSLLSSPVKWFITRVERDAALGERNDHLTPDEMLLTILETQAGAWSVGYKVGYGHGSENLLVPDEESFNSYRTMWERALKAHQEGDTGE